MIKTRQKYLTLLLILIALLQLTHAQACTVCQQCTNCSKDVLADTYIDGIDALLQKSLQNIGYPVSIARTPNSTAISYKMIYSNGLLINLALDLNTMQIQLINYSFNSSTSSTTTTTTTTTTSSASPSTSTTSTSVTSASTSNLKSAGNGYFTIDSFASNSQVAVLNGFVKQWAKATANTYQLSAVAFRNSSLFIVYRLSYQILGISGADVIQDVYVQVEGNAYKLLGSNYTKNDVPQQLTKVNARAILTDTYLSNINNNILDKYAYLLGSQPAVVDIMSNPPYYQITYQVDNTNYTFFLLYDYLQANIVRGNITASKLTTTTITTSNGGSTQTNVPSSSSTTSTSTVSSTSSTTSTSSSSSSSTSSNTVSSSVTSTPSSTQTTQQTS